MAGPNMATITASLERSFQNCSLNNNNNNNNNNQTTTRSSSASSSSPTQQHSSRGDDDLQNPNDTTTLELNSHISLPYHWEQCLDLKTGEIYYINWRNGMKAKEDPRTTTTTTTTTSSSTSARDYYYYYESDDEEEEEEEEEENSYESEESSSEKEEVLVVGGCKSCFMYFMVPKHVRHCPKCSGHLLHFNRSQNASL